MKQKIMRCENKRYKFNIIKKVVFIMIIVFFAELLILKDTLFYNEEIVVTDNNVDNGSMYNYLAYENMFIAQKDDACYKLDDLDVTANTINFELDNSLEENCNISIVFQNNAEEETVINRSVRAGCKDFTFRFNEIHISEVRISFFSSADNHVISISNLKSQLLISTFSLVSYNSDKLILILMLLIIAFVISFTISFISSNRQDFDLTKKERDSNIEFLRIMCMLLLIAHHFAAHGGLLSTPVDSYPNFIGRCLIPMGKICFVCFIAISMWFAVDFKNYRFERFFKTWLEVFFYSVLFTFVSYCMGAIITPHDFFASCFVMIGNSHGFAASYLIFLLLLPILIKITQTISKNQARYLLVVLLIVQVGSQTLMVITNYNQPVYSEVTLFVLCYFISLNLKKWPIKFLNHKYLWIIMAVGTWLFIFIINEKIYSGSQNYVLNVLKGSFNFDSSIFYLISGYSFFYIIKDIRISYNKVINRIATFTFGILLIHDHNFFRYVFWNVIVNAQTFFYSPHLVSKIILSIILIFYVCSVIDYLRQELFEKPVLKSNLYKKVCSNMNKYINIV